MLTSANYMKLIYVISTIYNYIAFFTCFHRFHIYGTF